MVIYLFLALATALQLNPLYLNSTGPQVSCSKYVCKSSPSTIDYLYGNCITYDNSTSTFELIPCSRPFSLENHCVPTTDSSKTPVRCSELDTHYSNLYPGEGPCSSSECISGTTCSNSKCMGKSLGDSCSSNSNCNAGLQCVSGKCADLIRPGEHGCTTDYDCVNTCGCDKTHDDQYGTCVPYFSVANQKSVNNCLNYNSLLCESTQCNSTAGVAVCTSPAKLQDTPTFCHSRTECYSPAVGLYGECTCGINPKGLSYCSPFSGDRVGDAFISLLKQWISGIHVLTCNTERRWDFNCARGSDIYEQFMYRQLNYEMFVELIDNDECISKIYTTEFYDLKDVVPKDKTSYAYLVSVFFLYLVF